MCARNKCLKAGERANYVGVPVVVSVAAVVIPHGFSVVVTFKVVVAFAMVDRTVVVIEVVVIVVTVVAVVVVTVVATVVMSSPSSFVCGVAVSVVVSGFSVVVSALRTLLLNLNSAPPPSRVDPVAADGGVNVRSKAANRAALSGIAAQLHIYWCFKQTTNKRLSLLTEAHSG